MKVNDLKDGRFEIEGHGIVWGKDLVKTLEELERDEE